MERASAFGFGSLNAPTTYRTLRRMESDGVIESSWSDSGDGPARRVYSITEAGLAYLDLWVEYLENYRRTMEAFLRLYTESSNPGYHNKSVEKWSYKGLQGRRTLVQNVT